VFLLAACETPGPFPGVEDSRFPVPQPGVEYENLQFCEHKLDDNYDFYHHGVVARYEQILFDRRVTTLIFNLLDNTEHYLSDDEFKNYSCHGA
jgi:hypothetical protein